MKEAKEKEKQYFYSHPIYSAIADCSGTVFLAKTLNKVYLYNKLFSFYLLFYYYKKLYNFLLIKLLKFYNMVYWLL
jgi:hypothetical protein